MEYIGVANYVRLVQDPTFWKVIGNTFAYLGLGVPISLLLSFIVAYYLDRVRFGHALLRALYFIPHLTTAVAMAWVWRWFYQPLAGRRVQRVARRVWASARCRSCARRRSRCHRCWRRRSGPASASRSSSFSPACRAIPRTYYEAAAIDGAGAWRVLFEVTLPLLRPTIIFLVVTSSIVYLRIFDYVYAMTNGLGGPLDATKPLVLMIFETAFKQFRDGLRSDTDGHPVRDPARHLARPAEAVAQPMTVSRKTSPGSILAWTLLFLGGIVDGHAVRLHAVRIAQAQPRDLRAFAAAARADAGQLPPPVRAARSSSAGSPTRC